MKFSSIDVMDLNNLINRGVHVKLTCIVFFSMLIWYLREHGVFSVYMERVSVMEGDPVTLNTGVKTKKQQIIRWYSNDIQIATITGDLISCIDVQCNEGDSKVDNRFRDRLKVDRQTGSLTITNTRTTDSGEYQLKIFSISGDGDSEKIFSVSVNGRLLVMEGDAVTLHTDMTTGQQDNIRWYFNNTLIAQITGDLRYICRDVQCNKGNERFRDRLKVDHQTGSLTITNTRTTDSGDYQMKSFSRSGDDDHKKSFRVSGQDFADEMKRKSVKEGGSVTLDPGAAKEKNAVSVWYFNNIRITGDQSQICPDDQCKERFSDRLKLDHQTGSLTITNTRTTDSGEYQLKISSSRFSIVRSFRVTVIVTAVPPARWPAGLIAGICVSVVLLLLLLVVAAAAKIYKWRWRRKLSSQMDPDHQYNTKRSNISIRTSTSIGDDIETSTV